MRAAAFADRDSRVTGASFTFGFVAADICNLTALSLLLYSLGRSTLGERVNNIATRVRAVFNAGGRCEPDVFSMDDYGHLAAAYKHIESADSRVRAGLQQGTVDAANRLWCGLTGDTHCPLTRTWAVLS